MAASSDPPQKKRLDSWKEIAAFFARAERTVKRWEAQRGLPVHRVPGGARSAVFAYSDELTDWLKGPGREPDSYRSPDDPGQPPARAVASRTETFVSQRIISWLLLVVLVPSVAVFVERSRPYLKASATRHVPDPEAQELYLKGRFFWNRRTPDDLNRAIDYFTQAIVKDPNGAQAYVGLADCYNLLREFGAMSPNEAYPRALSAAQRAAELDPKSPEAHISLAFVTYWWSWKALTAEREFKRALELDSHSVRAHHWYATYLLGRRRYSEALDQIEQARKLEPSSTPILADKGLMLWQSGRHDEALDLLTQLEITEPMFSSTRDYLGRIYWEQKDYGRALAEWRRLAVLRHDQAGLAVAEAREKGLASGGLQGLFKSELPVLKDWVDRGGGSAYELAATYAVLGMRQEALAYLQVSFNRHEEAMLESDPIPPLDNDPEYQKFRGQVRQLLIQ